jgi:hypothetical protein
MLINLLAFLGGMALGAGLACGIIVYVINADLSDETYRKERRTSH